MVGYKLPFNFYKWVEENKDKLQPPVGNYMLYDGGAQKQKKLIFCRIQSYGKKQENVIGGPNQRSDYHVEEGEEWFFQVKGDMLLKIVDNGEFKDIVIKEGEMFLLPPNIPHNPVRFEDTIGIVVERERKKTENDKLRWYCEKCKEIVYEEVFYCYDLGVQLKPAIERYYSSEENRTCKKCNHLNSIPKK